MPLNIRIQWNAGTACVSECVLKTLARRGLRVGPSKFCSLPKQVVLTNIGENSDSAFYPQQGILLLKSQKLKKNDGNGWCHPGKMTVCQKHCLTTPRQTKKFNLRIVKTIIDKNNLPSRELGKRCLQGQHVLSSWTSMSASSKIVRCLLVTKFVC